jgi:hypothetical protein
LVQIEPKALHCRDRNHRAFSASVQKETRRPAVHLNGYDSMLRRKLERHNGSRLNLARHSRPNSEQQAK